MDRETQLWNEYQSLREEIKLASTLGNQILGILVAATVAILTTGFQSDNKGLDRVLVFLCVYAATIPGYRLMVSNRRRVWRISTYMRVFLEPHLEFIKWETRLASQRKQQESNVGQRYLSSLMTESEWLIVSLLNVTAAAAAVFAGVIPADFDDGYKVVAAVVIIVLAVLVMLFTARDTGKVRRFGEVERSYYESWCELSDVESRVDGVSR